MIEDKHLEFTSRYRISDDLVKLLEDGRWMVFHHPQHSRQIHDMIEALPGVPEQEREDAVAEITRLFEELDRLVNGNASGESSTSGAA